MALYLIRRSLTAIAVLIASTFVMFGLVVFSGDPLADLRTDTSPGAEMRMRMRIENLGLDQPWPLRYLNWARGAAGCIVPGLQCDLGENLRGQEVSDLLLIAMGSTFRLVTSAVILAIVLGVAVGVITALRQYSGFDYTVTFFAFLFYATPTFFGAVLLKQYLAIAGNDWLADPQISWSSGLIIAVLAAFAVGAILGGNARQKWRNRGITLVVVLAATQVLNFLNWFENPKLGPVVLALAILGSAVSVTAIVAGLGNRSVLKAALTTAALLGLAQLALTPFLGDSRWSNWGTVLGTFGALLAIALVIGWVMGGLDRGSAMFATGLTAFLASLWIYLDLLLRTVPAYSVKVRGRIFPTVGPATPNFSGDFWQTQLDVNLHLLLPTLAMAILSFAAYSRYMRSSMLEVLSSDYVRTARAKGLPERTVITRHALRNALIPIATLVAFDFGALIGGAVITESVFGWSGMGALFVQGLTHVDPPPVMGFFVVTAVFVVLFNLIADVLYVWLDPRIRLS